MDVARLQPDPVHRRQVADRIALVGVQHQLGLRGGARGEVEEQRDRRPPSAPSGANVASAPSASANDCQPAGACRPRRRCGWARRARRRTARRGSAAATTALTSPRSTRSTRSSGPSSVDAGIITAPSFMAASIVSHSGTTLPSISSTWSPRRTPRPRRWLATRLERSVISAKVRRSSVPSSSTIHSAGRSPPIGVEVVERPVEVGQSGATGDGCVRPGARRERCGRRRRRSSRTS